MDNFFIVKKKTRMVTKEESYEYKYLDQRKLYSAIEEAKTPEEH